MRYMPEMGQMIFGQPCGAYALPDWVESMFHGIIDEWDRVYWNVNQKQANHRADNADLGAVHFRYYVFDYEDDPQDHGPNFWLSGKDQTIRWYKGPWRGLSCTKDFANEDWIVWHDAVMAELRRVGSEPRKLMEET
jgi:hypothetical protein